MSASSTLYPTAKILSIGNLLGFATLYPTYIYYSYKARSWLKPKGWNERVTRPCHSAQPYKAVNCQLSTVN